MIQSQCFVRVAVPVPLYRLFDYKIDVMPDIGSRVEVPFGKRHLIAIVVEQLSSADLNIDPKKVKPVSKVLDVPFLPVDLVELAKWIASYYLVPIGMVYELILPVKLRKGEVLEPQGERVWKLTDHGVNFKAGDLGRAKAQRALLEYLQTYFQANSEKLNHDFKQWRSIMKSLSEKKLVEPIEEISFEEYTPQYSEQRLTLTHDQHEIVDVVDAKQFTTHLIHGVTGSGKTEVYLSIVEKLLNKPSHQALLLVPEISLTPQFVDRVRRRLNKSVAVIHSALNDSQRHKAWWSAREGKVDIILGTRASVFTAFKDLQVIIVDEEHDASFKQQDGVRYHARDVAIMRAKQHNIPIVMGSATPSFEALHNVSLGKFKLATLQNRATGASLPDMHLIDTSDPAERLVDGLSPSLLRQIKKRLEAKQQSILFINRRGYSPTLYCTECAWIASCPRCDARVTAHLSPGRGVIEFVRCHHCGYQSGNNDFRQNNKQYSDFHICGDCKQTTVMPLGMGTQRSEEALKKLFPHAVVSRLDRDMITTKSALEKELHRIRNNEVDIVLGTQMLTKGHDFPDVTLVGVLDADQGLFALDFRGPEKLYQQLLQISGRAGRHQHGEVYIQTQFPEHPFFKLLLAQDYTDFSQREIEMRGALSYPPVGYMSLLRAESVYAKQGLEFLRWCRQQVVFPEGVFVSEAVPAPMEKRAGRYRAQLLLQSASRQALHQYQHQLVSCIASSKQQNNVRWSLDVDPIDLY